jgi:2-polyprenyl-6-methoxyphenol hydroxylase-like FAD-dependent oxidoreductase
MKVNNVLVVGGGITGTIASIALAQKGLKVTLIEISPQWFGVGHGITIQGNALKVLDSIGALNRLNAGFGFSGLNVYDASGAVLAETQMPKTGGEEYPAAMGILRSELQTTLVEMCHELDVEVRLDTEMIAFENLENSVNVTFANGSVEEFDFVIAADGIRSKTRNLLGMHHDKKPTGLGIWRTVTKRSPEMGHASVYFNGPSYKAGFTPISETHCYAYVLTDPEREANGLSNAEEMRRLLEGYHGEFDFIRSNISEGDYMNFQAIEWVFVDDQPWHQGRVILIGDAVHACPPLIAQGAAQCSEDALLIADYITRDGDMETLLAEFTARRKPRVKVVVDASLQLADWELHPDTPGANPAALMGSSLAALTQPA